MLTCWYNMGHNSGSASPDGRDEDDEDEYEEVGGGNRLLGFMFGNVDGSGDLDVDYLDEASALMILQDAKEHLAALADKLGPSLTDIDLSVKSPQTPADAAEPDYDEKAADAVDYEDIDEQYEGPEIQAGSEEDLLLPKKEYFSSSVGVNALKHTASIFDDENYDEDETETEHEVVENSSEVDDILTTEPSKVGPVVLVVPSEGRGLRFNSCDLDKGLDVLSEGEKSHTDDLPAGYIEAENFPVRLDDFHRTEPEDLEEPLTEESSAPLPILCVEDGMVILRFSEIFGVHEPKKKGDKVHKHVVPRDRYKTVLPSYTVEEDEEEFVKNLCCGFSFAKQVDLNQDNLHDFVEDCSEPAKFGVLQVGAKMASKDDEKRLDSCLTSEPMKEEISTDLSSGWQSSLAAEFYPLDQQDWEDKIIWANSPVSGNNLAETCEISGLDSDNFVDDETEKEARSQNLSSDVLMVVDEKDHSLFLRSCPVSVEPFGSRKFSRPANLAFYENNYHPQLLRLETRLEVDNSNDSEAIDEPLHEELHKRDAIRHRTRLTLQNTDMVDESWLDSIIWELDKPVVKPKLILDFQDEKMIFEIFENKDGKHLQLHAGAMIITRSPKSIGGDSSDLPGHGSQSIGRFNIANDRYYSNRKTSQQLKSHSKKRTAHGVKVLHSTPALKLQTMKPRLSNKDIANFHRPKALWYPHDNEVAVKEQGKLPTLGPMKIILKSLGGKGSKLHVDAEETIESVKAKASKKLDFKPSEMVKIFYSGKELEDHKTLAAQDVRPNSLLHLVRTRIHLLPRAQKLPGENKSLRPPGAFKKKSDLSAKDGHIFLMELRRHVHAFHVESFNQMANLLQSIWHGEYSLLFLEWRHGKLQEESYEDIDHRRRIKDDPSVYRYCEERPLLLGNVGMGARLCMYYQKSGPGDQTGTMMRNENQSLGTIIVLDPADKSPFLGDIKPGCSQSSLETNMYRAPIFPHKVSSTDFLLVRSAKGKLSLRRIDRINVVGQQEPHIEVIPPASKGLQTYIMNRLLVYMYREFRAVEKSEVLPSIRADELSAQFPSMSEAFLRKRLKHCADLQKGSNGQFFWVMKRNFRIPLEEELRRMVSPENVCAYESMQAGLYRLKRLGISKLIQLGGLSSAMNQLPDEAIALAAASHIERELQITPWNLSSNFDRENIERLEITGVGDPSGRGLGFSYVRTAPKAPVSNAMVKKKSTIGRGGSTVTGTDADLRRLSMEAAREVLLKFNVPDEHIAKQTRWHRIAMIRKLSSEQAATGVKVDPTTIGKYARGQRMSFLQLQQQAREKCQEIWDRQIQSLSAFEGDENESDAEANSDLDSFAGDLENLLDAEECEEGDQAMNELKYDKPDGVRGLKMRRHPSQAQAEEEIEDEAAEAAELCRMLMDDDEIERKKKKKTKSIAEEAGVCPPSKLAFSIENAEQVKKPSTGTKKIIRTSQPEGSFISKQNIIPDPKDLESFLAKRSLSGKFKGMKTSDLASIGILKKKVKIMGDGIKIFKEKKSARESFVCGACGQLGHMRTNKNCPKYGEDLDAQVNTADPEKLPGKSASVEPSAQPHPKPPKKLIPKMAPKVAVVESPEIETSNSKTNFRPLKLKCSTSEKNFEQVTAPTIHTSDRPVNSDAEVGNKAVTKVNKIIISNRKTEDVLVESYKPPSIVIRPPAEADRDQPRKKIIIKRPKEIVNLDEVSQEVSTGVEYRKTKKMIELSSFGKHGKEESKGFPVALTKKKAKEPKRWWEEEDKRRNLEPRKSRIYEDAKRLPEEPDNRLAELRRYQEELRREREEEEQQKAKKKKKKKRHDFVDEYIEDHRARRNERRMPERDRSAKRKPVVELGKYGAEYTPPTKRRRGGEVGLSNVLERIVDTLKDRIEVSYLFLKPVSKKEAPDYLDIIKHPMDLSTIREKVRKMEYKSREDFRHDVWQITFNAHKYNDGRNPGIPPLADQLLELCDYLLDEYHQSLSAAEAGIEEG
ncbi:TAFII-230 TBP-binding [Dillenia turbinata]|uniref:Transcription initiation factor TFIID subunit 1 n=1 Tax=Dillenia turbinata TaxID=194707 RepID=A0AAN8ZLC1_9MAGN